MKIITIFLSILILSVNAFAFDNQDDKIQTLVDSDNFHSGGFGGPELQITKILDETTLVMGGKGGWIINHTFVIGGAGYGIIMSPKVRGYKNPFYLNDDRDYYLRAGWGGLYLEYIYDYESLIHFTVSSLIGAGGISFTPSYKEMQHDEDHNYIIEYENSPFFILDPSIGIEFNIVKFFKIEIGASYRWTTGINLKDFDASKDFNGPSAKVSFKFGRF